MRVITVKQPWAWAIIHGGKDVENRVRNLAGNYRGPVAIHVGMNYATGIDSNELDEVMTDWFGANPDDPLYPWLTGVGSIIGVVDLTGVHQGHNTEPSRMRSVQSCYRAGKPYGPCSPWAQPDSWHLELENARPLAEPIPWKGALGMRILPDETAQLVLKRAITMKEASDGD